MLLTMLEQKNSPQTSIGGYLSLTLARICWASRREEEAHLHLARAFELAQNWHFMALLAECFESRALFALDMGELTEVEQNLHALRNLIQAGGIAIRLPHVESIQVRLWLARGNLMAAETWATQTHFEQDLPTDASSWETSLALAYLRLVQFAYEEALAILARLEKSAEQGQRRERVAQALALQIVVLASLKERQQARQRATRLLEIAQAGKLVRVFLNAGAPMRRILEDLYATLQVKDAPAPELQKHLTLVLAAFTQEEQPSSHVLVQERPTLANPLTPPLSRQHEPLSAQEQRVLRLLVAGHTYAEMASELIVSPNTIKTQVSSIYRKLGVSRRAEASLVAHHLHLL